VKVLVITSVYALSETDRNGSFLVESNRHLVQRGHGVEVLAPSYEGSPSHEVEGIQVHRFRYFPRRYENLTHGVGAPNRIREVRYLFIALFYIVAGLFATIRLCRRRDFDVIHVHWPFPHGIWGYAAKRLTGIPMVLTFHGAELLLARKFFFVKYFLRHAVRHADKVICNSNYTRGELHRLTACSALVIPMGTTIATHPVAPTRDKPTKDILFAGRFIRRKGVDILLRAIPEIRQRANVHLHLVGGGHMELPWQEMAASLGLTDEVTFHGVVSNERLAELYAQADVFVLPAIVDDRGDTEGLGVVLVEALAFRTPVVASAVGGIPDVVIDEKTGLLVREKDPAALAAAVTRLLLNPVLADRLAAAGLRHAQSYFDWNRITALVVDTYRAATARTSMPVDT